MLRLRFIPTKLIIILCTFEMDAKNKKQIYVFQIEILQFVSKR